MNGFIKSFCCILAAAFLLPASGAPFSVIENGRSYGVIVIPEKAVPVERKAASELQYCLAKSTGVKLPILKENQATAKTKGYFLGRTKAALKAGLDASRKDPNTYLIKNIRERLFITGKDGSGRETSMGVPAGTLFGVYRYLIKNVGVRWLWPGDGGEYIPKRQKITLDTAADFEIKKNLRTRIQHSFWEPSKREQHRWSRRVFNLCTTESIKIADGDGHIFDRYVSRYGKTHPEWFAMLPDGTRKNVHPTSVCLTNKAFQNELLKNWKNALDKERKKNPSARMMLNLQKGDVELNCVCKNCLALDGEDRRLPTRRYDFKNVGERYGKVAMELYKRMQKTSPGSGGVWLLAYQSGVYAPRQIKLNPDIQVKLVMDIPFPRRPEYTAKLREEYLAWKNSGATLTLRPNYFQGGYCMPEIWYDEFAEEFAFLKDKCGIVRFDMDGPPEMWSTRGINVYIASRLAAEPGTKAEELFKEYCEGFGPASKEVAKYFKYWLNYVKRNRDKINTAHEKLARMGWDFFGFDYPSYVHKVYPVAELRRSIPLLEAAAKAAAKDPDAKAKVHFLRQGLENAIRTVETAEIFADPTSSTAVRTQTFKKLQAFRKTLPKHAVDNHYLLVNERRHWKMVNNIPKDAFVLPENWSGCADPKNVGEKAEWFLPGFSDTKWKKVSTWKGLRAQDFRNYIHMWYRTRIVIPPELGSEKAILCLGAVDEGCKIWINGKIAGGFIANLKADPTSWNRSFKVDITEFIEYGKPINICVRVTKRNPGLGGIWKASWIELKNRLSTRKERIKK